MRGRLVHSLEDMNSVYPKVHILADGTYQVIKSSGSTVVLSPGDMILEGKRPFTKELVVHAQGVDQAYAAKIDPGNIVTFGGIPVTFGGEFVTYSSE